MGRSAVRVSESLADRDLGPARRDRLAMNMDASSFLPAPTMRTSSRGDARRSGQGDQRRLGHYKAIHTRRSRTRPTLKKRWRRYRPLTATSGGQDFDFKRGERQVELLFSGSVAPSPASLKICSRSPTGPYYAALTAEISTQGRAEPISPAKFSTKPISRVSMASATASPRLGAEPGGRGEGGATIRTDRGFLVLYNAADK